ncbi:unnamed protein product [Acanthoscelides obtectus]|uniref:THAP9-like helix-turn-helix domain-containing protein n=1 Tax=Acanthoscelides obtectus TaxID=200917 RepID=A0A9P0QI44_ACAOB|nr:unnamed protein product [Acanthoscelides obtectus]CAK1689361.1 hypothetical protein AOBTE_LOCUS37190 [Acanthoscelides obtectus]
MDLPFAFGIDAGAVQERQHVKDRANAGKRQHGAIASTIRLNTEPVLGVMSSESVSAENEDIDSEQPTTTSQMEFLKEDEEIQFSLGTSKKESIPEVQQAILVRHLKKGIKEENIALTEMLCFNIKFLFSSAYQYVRKVFGKNSLPHPRTLTNVYSTVDGTPGFSAEAIRAVK